MRAHKMYRYVNISHAWFLNYGLYGNAPAQLATVDVSLEINRESARSVTFFYTFFLSDTETKAYS